MADYDDKAVDRTGVQYCINSWNSRNVKEANSAMGYHNMGDKANRSKEPAGMKADKSRKQEMGGKFGY